MAPDGGDGRNGDSEGGDPADPEPGARPELLRHQTDDRTADRRAAEERHREQRGHPSSHLGSGLGLENAGGHHAYRRPSRSCPLRFGTGSTEKNSCCRMAKNAMTAAEYDTPLAKKHHETPNPAMTRPAIAGPITRAAMNIALLRLTALLTCSAPTISTTNARRAGLSKAFTAPRPSASTKIIQSWTMPSTVTVPRTRASTPAAA